MQTTANKTESVVASAPKTGEGFFFQPKLTINQPNDVYEQEADAMADKVMRMPDPAVNNNFFFKPGISSIQRKCTHCEEEEKLQKKESNSDGPVVLPQIQENVRPDLPLNVIQGKFRINQVDRAYQYKTDLPANKVMRMIHGPQSSFFFSPALRSVQLKCANCQEEEKKLQRKAMNADQPDTDALENYVGKLGYEGQPLSNEVKNFFEPRFNYDFSDVRIHNNAAANASAASIQAKGYTHGNNIVFGPGQYSDSNEGKSLLAHELTHVIQQTNDINRKTYVQKAGIYWMPHKMGGRDVHEEVLKAFGEKNSSKNIFSEAPVPTATASIVDLSGTGKIGYADLMTTDNGRLVGLYKTGEGMFGNINGIKKLMNQIILKGKIFSREKLKENTAPLWDEKNQKVTKIADAPRTVEVADLKPYEEISIKGGKIQLTNYAGGFEEVKDQVNKLVARGALYADSSTPWTLNVGVLKNLPIPDKYQFPTASGQHPQDLKITFGFVRGLLNKLKEVGSLKILAEYEKIREQNTLSGKLFVVENSDGIYTYAYIPDAFTDPTVMANLPGAGGLPNKPPFSDMMTLVENDIKGRLKGTSFVAKKHDNTAKNQDSHTNNQNTASNYQNEIVKPKSLPPKPVQRSVTKIQLKETEYKDNFDQKEWDKSLDTYQSKFTASLKTKEMKQLITYGDQAAGYEDLRKSLPKLKMPPMTANLDKPVSQLKSMEVWTFPGVGVLGTFRRLFGGAFVGIINTYEHVKEKIKNIAKKKDGGSVSSVAAAAIRIIVKVIKLMANYVVSKSLSLLVTSLQAGIADNLKALYESLMPDDIQKYIDEFTGIYDKYNELAGKTIEQWKKDFFGTWIDDYEKIEALINKIQPIASMVEKMVRWGAGIIACLSPPAIGCLWNIFKEIGMYFIAKIIQTCWFGTKVMGFLFDHFPQIINLPRTIANGIKGFANDHIPRPFGMKNLFAEIPEVSAKDYSMDCGEFESGGSGDGSGGDKGELYDMINEIGEDKFKAFLGMMRKRGAGDWVLLTPERLLSVKDDLKKASIDDLKKIAEGEKPAEGVSVSMEELLKDISKYTPREEKVKKDYFDEKKKREAAAKVNADAAGAGGGKTTAVDTSGGGGGSKSGPVKTMGEKATKTSTTQYVQFATNIYAPAFAQAKIPREILNTTVFVFYKDNPSDSKYEYYYVDGVKLKVKSFDGSMYTFINEEDFSVEYKPGTKHFFKKGLELNVPTKFVEFK